MTQRFSNQLLRNLSQNNIRPILVLQIDGVPYLIGSDTIKKVVRYGDEGLFYGIDDLYYGGLFPINGQKTLISFDGTTSSIKQELSPDKARGASVTAMTVVLADIDGEATKLASGDYGEILYKDIKLWVGFGEVSDFNNDYILVFRGLIESLRVGPSYVKLNLSSPDQKRRQLIAPVLDTELTASITNIQTTLQVDSIENLILVPDHPGYSTKDPALLSYVKIEEELIQFTGITGTGPFTLTGLVRGSLSTLAVSHSAGVQVESFYKLEGNSLDLALKIMLSDKDMTPYLEDLEVSSVNVVLSDSVDNCYYFGGVNLQRDYNVRAGDWVTTSGFANGANNLSSYTLVTNVVILDTGSYIVVDDTLVLEEEATGSVTFLSQYNSLGDFGLNMSTDEVDIEKHNFYKTSFLGDADVRFYIREEIEEAKEFIETQLYLPFACYSLPNDKGGLARMSLGLHVPPIPLEQIVTIDKTNVVDPNEIEVQRSINKYHYNAVGYVYNDSPLDEELRKKIFSLIGTQLVPTGNKALRIETRGFRDDLGAQQQAERSTDRLLNRYKGAAEFIDGLKVIFSQASIINIGDVVVFDPTDLHIINRTGSDRFKEPLLMEVLNKSIDIKNGKSTVTLIDTSFNLANRYGLISPSSRITKAITQQKFVIEHWNGPAYSSFGVNEGGKWINYLDAAVEIHNSDYTDMFTTTIAGLSGNVLSVDAAPGFTITDGDYFIKLAPYSLQPASIKLIFAFLSDDVNYFSDGGAPYVII